METEKTSFEGWAVVELMGRSIIAGQCSEVVIAGAAFLRVDVPANEEQPAFSKMYSAGAIYAITPTTEEVARVAAGRVHIRPIDLWVVPQPIPALPGRTWLPDDGGPDDPAEQWEDAEEE
jgi:hypothetical protein